MTPCYQRHEIAPGIHADIPHEHEGDAVKTMAEVLMSHRWAEWLPDGDGQGNLVAECGDCEHAELNPSVHEDEWLTNHQGAMLTAAGFGPVKAAQAEAWDQGMGDMVKLTAAGPGYEMGNPYRAYPHAPEQELADDYERNEHA